MIPLNKGKVLFDGDSTESVALTDSLKNFKYCILTFKNSNAYQSIRVDMPHDKLISVKSNIVGTSQQFTAIETELIYLNDKTINKNYNERTNRITFSGGNLNTFSSKISSSHLIKVAAYN